MGDGDVLVSDEGPWSFALLGRPPRLATILIPASSGNPARS